MDNKMEGGGQGKVGGLVKAGGGEKEKAGGQSKVQTKVQSGDRA